MALFGIQLRDLEPLSVEKALDYVMSVKDAYGIDAIEISLAGSLGRPAVFHYEEDYKRLFADRLGEFRIVGVHLPFLYLNVLAEYPPIAEKSFDELKLSLEYSADIGANYVVLHGDGFALFKSQQECRTRWREYVAELAQIAIERNIVVSIENAGCFLQLDHLADLVRGFGNDAVKLTLDTGHACFRVKHSRLQHFALRALSCVVPLSVFKKNIAFESYGSIGSFLEKEMDLVNNLHVHDFDGWKDHLVVGEGKIDFSFLKSLKKKDIPLIVETHFSDVGVDYENGIRRSFLFLKQFDLF